MKTFTTLILAIAMFLVAGCYERPESIDYYPFPQKLKVNGKYENRRDMPYKIIVLEGCEYIVMPTTHQYTIITHKGNCTNRSHIYKSK